ncbi:MAG: hypothetical protein AB1633_01090 [Elusimicrobiota bacterium]
MKNKKAGFRIQDLGVRKRLYVCLITVFLTIPYTLIPKSCLYATWLGGYYEFEYAADKNSDFPWNLRLPRHYLQTKIYTNPVGGVDMYGQFAAVTNEPWNSKQDFFLEKLYGKYWFKKGEIYVGAKEEKHFLDSPLLTLVNIDKASDKRNWFEFGRGQFSRLNIFDINGFFGSFYVSRNEPQAKSEWYGTYYDRVDTNYVARLGKRIFIDKTSSAALAFSYIEKATDLNKFSPSYDATGIFKLYNFQSSYDSKNSVLSGDFKYLSPYGSFIMEYALNPSSQPTSGVNDATAFEIRDIVVGSFRFLLKGYNYGKFFRAELSDRFSARKNDFSLKTDPEIDRAGFYSEVIYLNPVKMFNLTYKINFYETSFDSARDDQTQHGGWSVIFSTKTNVIWNYLEAYAEFVKGLKGKSGMEWLSDKTGVYPGAFVELYGETSAVYGRLQTRLKDIGSKRNLGERFIFAAELRVNITERMQAYTREVIVQSNYKKKNWSSLFYQLRYNILPDIETYIEYGEGYQTDNLAFDNDILNNDLTDTVHLVKMIFKVNF